MYKLSGIQFAVIQTTVAHVNQYTQNVNNYLHKNLQTAKEPPTAFYKSYVFRGS